MTPHFKIQPVDSGIDRQFKTNGPLVKSWAFRVHVTQKPFSVWDSTSSMLPEFYTFMDRNYPRYHAYRLNSMPERIKVTLGISDSRGKYHYDYQLDYLGMYTSKYDEVYVFFTDSKAAMHFALTYDRI